MSFWGILKRSWEGNVPWSPLQQVYCTDNISGFVSVSPQIKVAKAK
jgi:hypothetical protein